MLLVGFFSTCYGGKKAAYDVNYFQDPAYVTKENISRWLGEKRLPWSVGDGERHMQCGWQWWRWSREWRYLVYVGNDYRHNKVDKDDAEEADGGNLFMLAMTSATMRLTKVTWRRRIKALCSCWQWWVPKWGWQRWHWGGGWRYLVHFPPSIEHVQEVLGFVTGREVRPGGGGQQANAQEVPV